jgi:glycosyltransferase involved in cell wall biosynthesis
VLSQSYGDLECIVVDDASPEPATPAADPRVRLLTRDRNGGPAAARNTGIAAARGRYLAFLDDDDVWLPERLSGALEAHERAPVAICWQATLGAPGDGGTGTGTGTGAQGRVLEGNVADTMLDGITPHLGATTIERERAPLFDEQFLTSEDVDWWIRVVATLPVATSQRVGMLYRLHDGPRSRTGAEERVRGARLLLDEHADWFRAHPRAKAFRLKRMGLAALQAGDRAVARRCFARSFALRPEPRTAWHAVRTLAPRHTSHPGEDLEHV